MNDWRSKDDADLTAEDLSSMLAAGVAVAATGPAPPGSAVIVTAFPVLAKVGPAQGRPSRVVVQGAKRPPAQGCCAWGPGDHQRLERSSLTFY